MGHQATRWEVDDAVPLFSFPVCLVVLQFFPMRMLTVFLMCLALTGCDTARSYNGYLVTKLETEWRNQRQEPACDYPNCQVLVITLRHRGNTIKTNCQAFDVMNKCFSIRVGETYNFKRSDNFGLLSIDEPKVTLSVQKEEMQ